MIRAGEKKVIETPEQFIAETDFDKVDALVANDVSILSEANSGVPEGEQIHDLEAVPQGIIDDLFAELETPIVPTLRADEREWVHLRDGPLHRIVKLHPDDTDAEPWVEGKVTDEAISASMYQNNSDGTAVLVDDWWASWADVVGEATNSWNAFGDVEIAGVEFTLQRSGNK